MLCWVLLRYGVSILPHASGASGVVAIVNVYLSTLQNEGADAILLFFC